MLSCLLRDETRDGLETSFPPIRRRILPSVGGLRAGGKKPAAPPATRHMLSRRRDADLLPGASAVTNISADPWWM
jgi:hypothetical protein